MIKLRLIQPGRPPVEKTVKKNVAEIGRGSDCDLVVNEPHVSKRHVRVLAGVVAVDLGSSNGTLVDGLKIEQPTLLVDGSFLLGTDDLRVEVVTDASGSAPAAGDAGAGEELRGENERLARELAELRRSLASAPPPPTPSPAPERRLEQENQRLRQRVEELERERAEAPPPPPAPAPLPASDLFSALQAENRELERELERLERELAAARAAPAAAPPVPARPVPAAPPVPAPRPFPGFGAGGGRVAGLLEELVRSDDEDRAPALEGPLDEFFTVESFRILRKVEKVVTRIAGEFIQLLQARTVLPGVEGNFRALAADVFAEPQSPEPRRALVEYLDHLRRWLVVSLGAYRQAAVQLASEIKSELTEPELTSKEPVSALKRVLGKSDAELWRRARGYLDGLRPAIVEERLDALAREAAQELLS